MNNQFWLFKFNIKQSLRNVRSWAFLRPTCAKSKESDLELKLNELVVELGRSLQKIAQPIQSSMNRTLMSV